MDYCLLFHANTVKQSILLFYFGDKVTYEILQKLMSLNFEIRHQTKKYSNSQWQSETH